MCCEYPTSCLLLCAHSPPPPPPMLPLLPLPGRGIRRPPRQWSTWWRERSALRPRSAHRLRGHPSPGRLLLPAAGRVGQVQRLHHHQRELLPAHLRPVLPPSGRAGGTEQWAAQQPRPGICRPSHAHPGRLRGRGPPRRLLLRPAEELWQVQRRLHAPRLLLRRHLQPLPHLPWCIAPAPVRHVPWCPDLRTLLPAVRHSYRLHHHQWRLRGLHPTRPAPLLPVGLLEWRLLQHLVGPGRLLQAHLRPLRRRRRQRQQQQPCPWWQRWPAHAAAGARLVRPSLVRPATPPCLGSHYQGRSEDVLPLDPSDSHSHCGIIVEHGQACLSLLNNATGPLGAPWGRPPTSLLLPPTHPTYQSLLYLPFSRVPASDTHPPLLLEHCGSLVCPLSAAGVIPLPPPPVSVWCVRQVSVNQRRAEVVPPQAAP